MSFDVRPDACVGPSAHNRGAPTLPPTMCAAATAHLEGVRVEDKLGVVLPVLAVRRPACKRQHIKINGGEHGSWLAQARARWLPFVGCACGGGLGRPRGPPPRARGRGVAVGSCPGRARAAGFGLRPRVAHSLHACMQRQDTARRETRVESAQEGSGPFQRVGVPSRTGPWPRQRSIISVPSLGLPRVCRA